MPTHHPHPMFFQRHLANAATINMASAYIQLAVKPEQHQSLHHVCCLKSTSEYTYVPSPKEIGDLRMLDSDVDAFAVQAFSIANIMGVHFRAGEWGQSAPVLWVRGHLCDTLCSSIFHREHYGCVFLRRRVGSAPSLWVRGHLCDTWTLCLRSC